MSLGKVTHIRLTRRGGGAAVGVVIAIERNDQMGKNLGGSLAGPDDPIFREVPGFYIKASHRGRTAAEETEWAKLKAKPAEEEE